MGVVQTVAQIFLGNNEIDYKRTHVATGIHKKKGGCKERSDNQA